MSTEQYKIQIVKDEEEFAEIIEMIVKSIG